MSLLLKVLAKPPATSIDLGFETELFKSSVKPSIRRTGAKIINFSVLNRKFYEKRIDGYKLVV
jgi:hypothetical protein